jgi:hypothetical protein
MNETGKDHGNPNVDPEDNSDGIDSSADGSGFVGVVVPGRVADSEDDLAGVDWTAAKDAGQADESKAAEKAKVLNILSMDRSAKDRERILEEIRADIKPLVKRAKAIRKQKLDEFPETTSKVVNGIPTIIVLSSDINRWAAFELLFGGDESPERPFFNEFSGMRTDRDGQIINTQYSVNELVKAVSELGIQGQNAKTIRESFAEWALEKRRNPLTERITAMLPEWDGEKRIENSMMELFECFDTPLNRAIGWYFWTALYVRCVYGGHNAGIVLSLFGAQNCGKSYFAVRIVREILNDQDALPTPLDLSGGTLQFLRTITGNSIIANIPEMTGFTRADLNKVKAFVTQASDTFDFKFEGSQTQKRQWLTVMDGNKYAGMQRDDTGNRRFYPVFCGQLEEDNGTPKWKEEPYQCEMIVDPSRRFEEYMWGCLAEAHAWIEKNGLSKFNQVVGEVAAQVQEFSKSEMARGSGVVEDSLLSTYGLTALFKCQKHVWVGRKDKAGKRAVDIKPVEFHQRILAISKRDAIPSHVDSFFASLGAQVVPGAGGKKTYRFFQYETVEAFNDHTTGLLAKLSSDDGEYEVAVGTTADEDSRGGGF